MKFKLINGDQQMTYDSIMDNGDDVTEQLMVFAKKEKVNASQFTAIGTFSETVTGFLDFAKKEYQKLISRKDGSARPDGRYCFGACEIWITRCG